MFVIALPKWSTRVTRPRTSPGGVSSGRTGQGDQTRGFWTEDAEWHAEGQVGGNRREDVPPVEGRAHPGQEEGRVVQNDRLDRPAGEPRAGHPLEGPRGPGRRAHSPKRPLSGPTKRPWGVCRAIPRRALPTPGSTTATKIASAGSSGSFRRACCAPSATSWGGNAWHRSTTRAEGLIPRMTPFMYPDVDIGRAKVGQQDDWNRPRSVGVCHRVILARPGHGWLRRAARLPRWRAADSPPRRSTTEAPPRLRAPRSRRQRRPRPSGPPRRDATRRRAATSAAARGASQRASRARVCQRTPANVKRKPPACGVTAGK